MEKLKELLSKNNYIAAKLIGAILAILILIIAMVAITWGSKDNEKESETGNSITGSEETTTNVNETDSGETGSEESGEESSIESSDADATDNTQSSDETTTLSEDESATKEEETTSQTVADNNDETTSSKRPTSPTTEKVTTTKPPTTTTKPAPTTKPTTTKPTTTKPTTTKQPETTTEEETTTAPPRGANGVILETLTVYGVKEDDVYTVPATWGQLVNDLVGGDESKLASYGPMYTFVPKRLLQNALGNELMLYNQADGTGSTKEDVIAIYGQPLYIGRNPSTGSIGMFYRYLGKDVPSDQILYVHFGFSAKKTNNKLSEILFSNAENFSNNPYTEELK